MTDSVCTCTCVAFVYLLQGQTPVRTVMMHSMADWYMRGASATGGAADLNDQTRLSRILDVAQDLKALSMLLKATPFAFVIDLACLASRREYLKLEKWLHDKIRENQVCLQCDVISLQHRSLS